MEAEHAKYLAELGEQYARNQGAGAVADTEAVTTTDTGVVTTTDASTTVAASDN